MFGQIINIKGLKLDKDYIKARNSESVSDQRVDKRPQKTSRALATVVRSCSAVIAAE